MADDKIYVTQKGLEDLQNEYNNLVHVIRNEVREELRAARAQGDLSENADYDAARERQAQVEARIADLEVMLQNYEIIETSKGPSKTVEMGATVELEFSDTGEIETYTIVGATEADPLNGKVSNETPLGQAILKKKLGSTQTVDVDNPYTVKILSIN
ncbi:MAG: transcription elongation factor GreA [Erysipelotrichaceae bacterium]|nr:transcription elongation factor GreA [Erysipelotrichaceae bacterium]